MRDHVPFGTGLHALIEQMVVRIDRELELSQLSERRPRRWLRTPPEIDLLAAAAASDVGLIGRITELFNRGSRTAEEGLWADGAGRTTTSEVARMVALRQVALARIDGRIVGAVRVRQLDAQTGELGMLVADPARRGEGIGRRLVAFAEQLSRERDLAVMQLELLVPLGWPDATRTFLHAWFTRIGYRPERSGPVDDSSPHLARLLATPCDVIVYHKHLRP
jgi:GNAT superfamily N-acetyltransferase